MNLAASELILRPDGNIYHLGIAPGFLSDKIITVGDPERASLVASFFDKIHCEQHNREFVSITGEYDGTPMSVISTGIGTDNIDIVFNEVDALFNIDFSTRKQKTRFTPLSFFRLGTSGIVGDATNLGDIVVSAQAIGFDALSLFYDLEEKNKGQHSGLPYYRIRGTERLIEAFDTFPKVRTATMPGFYGPQNRFLRLKTNPQIDFWAAVKALKIDNLEMESAGIYLLSYLLGHQAISINALLAHRKKGNFHPHPQEVIEQMITKSLPIIAHV